MNKIVVLSEEDELSSNEELEIEDIEVIDVEGDKLSSNKNNEEVE